MKERLREWTYEAGGGEALDAMAPEERGTSKLINDLAVYFWKLGEYDRPGGGAARGGDGSSSSHSG